MSEFQECQNLVAWITLLLRVPWHHEFRMIRKRRGDGGPSHPGMTPMAKRSQRASPQHTATDPRVVTIRSLADAGILETPIMHPERLGRVAQQWSYILRARARWTTDPDLCKSMAISACKALESLGIPCQRVQSLASAGRIEVEFHDWDPDDPKVDRIHESASEVPWEYLISAATRVEGRYGSLLISRLFRNGMSAVLPHPPSTVLFVESAPGRIKELYEFSDEEERIRVAVGADRRQCVKILNTPKLSELRTVTEKNWEAIHVTGIDTHQAGWLIENFYQDFPRQKPALWKEITRSDRLCDGMIMREGREIELPVPYDKLAKALVGAKPAPRIVTLNLYYSGGRLARELVRLGAHSALGFLDEIDDELAELFFQALYWEWCHANPAIRIPDAFLGAWHRLSGRGRHGTSIAIWTGRSIFDPPATAVQGETNEAVTS
jgi:hypothetical protein